jgi:hypothetical protein
MLLAQRLLEPLADCMRVINNLLIIYLVQTYV